MILFHSKYSHFCSPYFKFVSSEYNHIISTHAQFLVRVLYLIFCDVDIYCMINMYLYVVFKFCFLLRIIKVMGNIHV